LSDGGYLPVEEWSDEGWGSVRTGVWRCPSVLDSALGWSGGYGVSENHIILVGGTTHVKLTQVKRLSEVALIGDARRQDGTTCIAIHCPVCENWDGVAYGIASDRHTNGANVCFVDGHVEWWRYVDLRYNKDDVFAHYSK
jgi:prepilin-type processing-associated H-X9-DG protein